MKQRQLHVQLRPGTVKKILNTLSESKEVCKLNLGRRQLKVNIAINKDFQVADIVVSDYEEVN